MCIRYAINLFSFIATWQVTCLCVHAQDVTRTVDELVKALADSVVEVRRDAAYDLAKLGKKATVAVPALVNALDDADYQVWYESIMTLSKIGPDAAPAIEVLVKDLGNREAQRRYRTAFTLGKIGPAAIPELVLVLQESSLSTNTAVYRRTEALRALGFMGPDASPAIDVMIRALADDSQVVHQQTAESIGKIGNKVEAQLRDALAQPSERVRAGILIAIRTLPQTTPETVAVIRAATNDAASSVRAAALLAMPMDADNQELIRLVETALRDKETVVREAGISTTVKLGRLTDKIVPMLLQVLESTEPTTRESAAYCLGRLGNKSSAAVRPMLTAMRLHPSQSAHYVRAISQIGAPAVEPLLEVADDATLPSGSVAGALSGIGFGAAKPLTAALAHNKPAVRIAAVTALGSIKPSVGEAVVPLANLLSDDTPAIRAAAVEALGNMQSLPSEVIAQVMQMVTHNDATVRARAIIAVAALDIDSDQLATIVKQSMSDSDAIVRSKAMSVIVRWPDVVKQMIKELESALRDPHPAVRASACEAIAVAEEKAVAAIDDLIFLLEDDDDTVRLQAINAIGKIGPSANAAVPKLIELLGHEDESLVLTAASTLRTFGSAAQSAAPALWQMLSRDQAPFRMAAIETFAKLGLKEEEIASVVQKGLEDNDWSVRKSATSIVGSTGKAATAFVPKLLELLGSSVDRDSVRDALRQIEAVDKSLLPLMLDALKSDDSSKRYYAIFFLGKLGPDAKEALPELKRLLSEREFRGRGILERTIQSIEGTAEKASK